MARRTYGLSFAVAVSVAICVSGFDAAAADVTVADADGTPIGWSSWIDEEGPAAVVLWASWIPDAEVTLGEVEAIARMASSKDLGMVLVSVQESPEETRALLSDDGVPWLNDRHGGLLKQFRVVAIPALVIVARDGRVLARLDPTADALREWKSE